MCRITSLVMYCAGNVIFHDADSASKAILGLGTMASPEEDPDGFGETSMLHKLCQRNDVPIVSASFNFKHTCKSSQSTLQCNGHTQHASRSGHTALTNSSGP